MSKKYLSLAEEYKEYDQMWEWVDNKGNKVVLSNTQPASVTTGPTARPTTRPTKISNLKDKYDKLMSHLRSMYSLKVNRQTSQLLDVDIKEGTKFKNKLIVTYDYQKDCLVGALYDEFGKEVSSNNCWGGWRVLITWLKKEGFPLINYLCESKLNEWVDNQGNKRTNSGHSSGWSLVTINSPEVCEGCGQIVEFNPNLKNNQIFFEPFRLKNGHKLCSECMEVWIGLPKGFVDKMNIISQYEILGGDIDEFVENIKLSQKDVDDMIAKWNSEKKLGHITLSPREIGSIETHFVEAVQKLGLKAAKTDFI